MPISDELKIPKEDLLLGDKTVTRANCDGTTQEVHGLLANDLDFKLQDGTIVNLLDYVIQQAITISNLAVSVINTNDIVVTWSGNQDVTITVGSQEYTSTGTNSYTIENLSIGTYSVTVKANGDQRGLTKDNIVIELEPPQDLVVNDFITTIAEGTYQDRYVGSIDMTINDATVTSIITTQQGFSIDNNGAIKYSGVLDYEVQPQISNTIVINYILDGNTQSKTINMTIDITDVADTPPQITSINLNSINEGIYTNAVVGSITLTGDGNKVVTFDDQRFSVSGSNILVSGSFDFETEPSVAVTATVTSEFGFNTAQATLNVLDVNEVPLSVTIIRVRSYQIELSFTGYTDVDLKVNGGSITNITSPYIIPNLSQNTQYTLEFSKNGTILNSTTLTTPTVGYGSNLIINGDFNNGSTNWIDPSNIATFTNNNMHINSSTYDSIYQLISPTKQNVKYNFSYDIVSSSINTAGYILISLKKQGVSGFLRLGSDLLSSTTPQSVNVDVYSDKQYDILDIYKNPVNANVELDNFVLREVL